MIVTIANGKGGVGKSTVAINLAGALVGERRPVLLVDADPQGTVSEWLRSRQEQGATELVHKELRVSPLPYSAEELTEKVPAEAERYAFVIIDCGPANDHVARSAFAVAAFAIVPVTPSPYDVRSVRKTIDMVLEGKESARIRVQPYLLVSRKIVGTTLGREVRQALEVFNVPILRTEICQRVALCEAGIVGQTIREYAPNSQAAGEFESLGREVLRWQRRS